MSPLKAALDAIEPENLQNNRREALLLTLYAFTAEAGKNSMLDTKDKEDTQIAAEARVYASIMEEIQKELGRPPTVLGRVSTAPTVQYTSTLPSRQGKQQP